MLLRRRQITIFPISQFDDESMLERTFIFYFQTGFSEHFKRSRGDHMIPYTKSLQNNINTIRPFLIDLSYPPRISFIKSFIYCWIKFRSLAHRSEERRVGKEA